MYIEHTKTLDAKNGDMIWQYTIAKETYQMLIAFKILEKEKYRPPGWTKSSGHLKFDLNMDFNRKERWVKDGHRTPYPETSIYSPVVSC